MYGKKGKQETENNFLISGGKLGRKPMNRIFQPYSDSYTMPRLFTEGDERPRTPNHTNEKLIFKQYDRKRGIRKF